uniref:C2H2-type domain-containing protein n=1 Tax=Astatotilapia calliptera TaxID=8154 RepID=A0A3P8PDW3_ASTCA
IDSLNCSLVVVGNDMRSTSAEMKPEPLVAPCKMTFYINVTPLSNHQHESLQCFQCFITFCNSKAKERHMRKSHRDQYKQQLQQSNTVFTCYKCEKFFSSSEELSKHQATHSTEEKAFVCSYCQKSFFTFTELNQHRRHECKERRCPCRDCGASFPSPSRLRSHRIAMHPQPPEQADDLNTFQCCKCHQSFQTEEELLQHQEKFAREINCDAKLQGKKRGRKPKHAAQGATGDSKRIKQEGADNHEEYSDPPTDGCSSSELQIPCPEADCDLIFPSVLALRAHKQVGHNPHACIQCDESFAQREQLSAHKATAHNSRYTCLTCAKSFTRESSLKAHESTHTEREEGAENT